MKNKAAKDMIVHTTLKGRKLFWFGEETEIFVAKSLQHLADEFGWPDEDEPIEDRGGLVPLSWLWKQGYDEEEVFVPTPVINWVFGGSEDICQLSTSYN